MGYAVARKHAAKLRNGVMALLALAVMFMVLAIAVPPLAVIAAIAASAASVIERWLFFAEAQHVVTLFYGATAA